MVQYAEFLTNYEAYKKYEADRFYLAWDQLFYDNDIVGLQHIPGFPDGITPIWRNGYIAPVEWPSHLQANVEQTRIPGGSIIYKVIMFYNQRGTQLGGVQFFDPNGKMLLKAGNTHADAKTHEIILKNGQRLIGAKAKLRDASSEATCFDFLFVIGQIQE
jgi:hypothetical protein